MTGRHPGRSPGSPLRSPISTLLSRRALLAGVSGLTVAAAAGCGRTGASRRAAPVTAWYHRYGEAGTATALHRYARTFSSPVTVDVLDGDYDARAADALGAVGGPDVFEYGNGPNIDMIVSGAVADLTGVIGDARSDFTPALLDRMTYRGRIYGIPQTTDLQLFVYRRSMFAQAGVTAPRTLDELVSAARVLSRGAVRGVYLGHTGGVDVVGGPVVFAAGHDYLTEDYRPAFVEPEVYDGLSTLRSLYLSGDLLLDAPTDWSDPAAFIAGRTAVQWTGMWALPTIAAALGDDVGVFPFPAIGRHGGPVAPFGAYGAAVAASGVDPGLARRFVQWLWVERTDLQLDWSQAYGMHVPARTSLLARAAKLRTGLYADAAALLNTVGRPQSPLMWTSRCDSAFRAAIAQVVCHGADPATELRAAADVVTKELARFQW
ncbi:ABC transporter substrate-binding protein [Tsukamurella soli]|uniref:Sugar ABC transporter substrate-binding protein n=1 Tax=Tsukamurella soli TaxID=644556 RepID=A0ABP8J949_9ACTN